MKKRRFFLTDIAVGLLILCCAVLVGMVAFLKPWWLLIVVPLLLLALLLGLLSLRGLRAGLRRALGGETVEKTANASGIATLDLPVVAVRGGRVLWYNNAFFWDVTGHQDVVGRPLDDLTGEINYQAAAMPGGQALTLNNKRYTVYAGDPVAPAHITLLIFLDETELKNRSDEYFASRPAVLFYMVDTYDDVLRKMREVDRSRLMSDIDQALEEYTARTSGFLRRISASRYMAVVEERHLEKMMADRFDILDTVRDIDSNGASVSLSIGVGRGGTTLKECEEMALQALDMALGRGGDQAAVRRKDGFEFYGGITHSVEKRTKVKSRIIAAAIKDLIEDCDRVLIMGHKNSDMDSVGAAVGMLRFCRICRKPAAIVVDSRQTHAHSLLTRLRKNGYSQDILSPDQALMLAGERTLLVIVDTHLPNLLESQAVYNTCELVVVIDHHRKMVGHIDDAVLFYHELYASSASELVAELLQYVGESARDKPTPIEAEALLAGIILDTRNFSMHVGVRTFEAAAYLRSMGAETGEVKKLFASSKDEYLYRSHLVNEAEMHGGIAAVTSDAPPYDSEVLAPQTANELLTIEGVTASIVALKVKDEVRISARSVGTVNVQLIMEKLGGGGHLTMAGAQLQDVSLDNAKTQIHQAIDDYLAEHQGKEAANNIQNNEK